MEGPQQAEHLRINEDSKLRVREHEADLGIPKITVSEILTQNPDLKHVVANLFLASATRAEGASCCSWENHVRSQGAFFEGD